MKILTSEFLQHSDTLEANPYVSVLLLNMEHGEDSTSYRKDLGLAYLPFLCRVISLCSLCTFIRLDLS